MLANQLHKAINDSALGVAIGVGLEVPQIANMSLGVGGPAVILAEWVEVWAGRGAAIGVVAKLVDVHATLGRRIAAADVVGDGRGGGFGLLLERDDAGDFGVATDDGDCGGVNGNVGGEEGSEAVVREGRGL